MVNLHEIFTERDSRLAYTKEITFDENTIASLEHKNNRHIRVMIGILLHGNDDRFQF